MKHKSDTKDLLVKFIHMVETQFNTKVKIIRSDNGPEFKLENFYVLKGIMHQSSCVNTPQQNGVAERKHQHLLNVARALLFQACLPKHFWGDAILASAYLINRTPTPLLQGKTPFEKLFHKDPTYSHLRVFGSLCFASTHAHIPSKFDPRATRVFLGYFCGQKGYHLFDLTLKKVFVSHDVVFFEDQFPYHNNASSAAQLHTLPPTPSLPQTHIDFFNDSTPQSADTSEDPPPPIPSPLPTSPAHVPTSPRRSTRPTKPSTFLQDFHVEVNIPSRFPRLPRAWFNLQVHPTLSPIIYHMTTSLINTKPSPLISPLSRNLLVFLRLFRTPNGVMPCNTRLQHCRPIIPGLLCPYHLTNFPLAANGCTR